MLYFAYGSNLNLAHMKVRCPNARALGKLTLHDAKLVFRGVADIIYHEGGGVPGGLWKITSTDEAALDRYEGIGSGMYRKEYVPISGVEGETELMYYAMNSEGIFPPSQFYLDTLIQGYEDFGLPQKYLAKAVAESWKDKRPSYRERQRYRRTGRPPLAKVRKDKAGNIEFSPAV